MDRFGNSKEQKISGEQKQIYFRKIELLEGALENCQFSGSFEKILNLLILETVRLEICFLIWLEKLQAWKMQIMYAK